jgi:orotidine-5'-phosphate decarboxylase
MTSFGARLSDSWQRYGHLCVGIDPHDYLLDIWELDNSAMGAREFSLRVLDACVGVVGVIKPQVSFFERFGSPGFAALETLLARARDAEVLVIADAKRGDIGSTMDGYANAWLSPESALSSDALTVAPYLGVGSLEGLVTTAETNDRGLFVLGVTSNPEATTIQSARLTESGESVSGHVVRSVRELARADSSPDAVANIGVVIGASTDLGTYGLSDEDLEGMPILAPGFGAQGAAVRDARSRFGRASSTLIVAQSRSILESGREGVADAVRREANEVADAFV